MGSYIGIVAIYIKKLDSFNGKILNMIDKLKRCGIKLSNVNILEDFPMEASVNTNCFSSSNCLFTISDNRYFRGIVLEIPESELLNNNYSNEKINEVDGWLFALMKKICATINCDYIFCDNEADILDFQYSCYDGSFNTNFSIFINNIDKTIVLNDWNIDGLSKRTAYYNN